MEKKYWWLRPVLAAPLVLGALLTLLSAFVNIYLFYLEALLLICVCYAFCFSFSFGLCSKYWSIACKSF